MPDRRTVLKLGLVAGAALAAGGGLIAFAGRDAAADRAAVLGAVVPAVLGDALPPASPAGPRAHAIARTVAAVEAAIAGLAPAAQDELGQLFLLLASGPGRRVLAGVSRRWPEASADEVGAFLERWRRHRLGTMRSGYHALHDLVAGAWYASPEAWAAIGYPGPPRL